MTNTITLSSEVAKRILRNIEIGNKLSASIELRREIEAALEQPDVRIPTSVPAGWKLVPVEPTLEMIKEMCAYDGTEYSNPFDSDDFKDDYRNMLAAAPHPTVVEHPQGEQEPVAWIENIGGGVSYNPYHEAARKLPDGVRFDLYTHPQPKREPLNTDKWPEYPAPSVRPVYATSANTKAVRDGFEVGGYEKTPPLFTKSQLDAYALNVLRAHGIGGEA